MRSSSSASAQTAGLEQDQAEVGAQDLRGRVVLEQRPRRVGGLVVVTALELEQREQVEDVLVARPQRPRLLELAPGPVELPVAHAAPRAVQVEQEESLIDGGQIAGGGRPRDASRR